MPKRDQTPPYEIMRSKSRPSARTSAVADAQDQASDPDESAQPEGGSTAVSGRRPPWWVGSTAPVVLRLPRGLAALSVAGLLLLIVIAYWVGAVRGAAAVKTGPDELGIGDRPAPGWFEAQQKGYGGPEVGVPEKPVTAERREPGLNYMRLIESSKKDCEALAEFFGAREVAIQLVPVNNGKTWVAYAVKRGYRRDELKSESRKLYEQQLRSLGRQWKQNGGGTDLSTMYFDRYDG